MLAGHTLLTLLRQLVLAGDALHGGGLPVAHVPGQRE